MASQNYWFRLYLKSGRKYRIMLIDYTDKNAPKKSQFGDVFLGRNVLDIKQLWDEIEPLIGKSSIGYEIQRVNI